MVEREIHNNCQRGKTFIGITYFIYVLCIFNLYVLNYFSRKVLTINIAVFNHNK